MINKSDIVQTRDGVTHTYEYSHCEEFIVEDKIWIRHIWIRQTPHNYLEPLVGDSRLMDFERTDRPASEFTGERIYPPPRKSKQKAKRKIQPTPPEATPKEPPKPPVQKSKPGSLSSLIRPFRGKS